jgi:hypothetical protein
MIDGSITSYVGATLWGRPSKKADTEVCPYIRYMKGAVT